MPLCRHIDLINIKDSLTVFKIVIQLDLMCFPKLEEWAFVTVPMVPTCKTVEPLDGMIRTQFAKELLGKRRKEIASIDQTLLLHKTKESVMVPTDQTCKIAEPQDGMIKTQFAKELQEKRRKEIVLTDLILLFHKRTDQDPLFKREDFQSASKIEMAQLLDTQSLSLLFQSAMVQMAQLVKTADKSLRLIQMNLVENHLSFQSKREMAQLSDIQSLSPLFHSVMVKMVHRVKTADKNLKLIQMNLVEDHLSKHLLL